jgi:hypothetical protein
VPRLYQGSDVHHTAVHGYPYTVQRIGFDCLISFVYKVSPIVNVP